MSSLFFLDLSEQAESETTAEDAESDTAVEDAEVARSKFLMHSDISLI